MLGRPAQTLAAISELFDKLAALCAAASPQLFCPAGLFSPVFTPCHTATMTAATGQFKLKVVTRTKQSYFWYDWSTEVLADEV